MKSRRGLFFVGAFLVCGSLSLAGTATGNEGVVRSFGGVAMATGTPCEVKDLAKRPITAIDISQRILERQGGALVTAP